jgi:hypothetical protein
MPFFLDGNPTDSEISEAVNYLLSNFSSSVSSDPNTGQIMSQGKIIGYLYKYMAVKYADSYDGSVNFSNSPTNKAYFGLRNNNDAAESTNPADYLWSKAAGGFGTTKFLWYITTGGRNIQFAIATAAPDVGWLQDTGASIDLDVLTSATVPIIVESFATYFTPPILQVPRSGSPLTPTFTGVIPVMYATDKGVVIPFTDAQTDTSVGFVNNSWRIGNSSTTGNADISYTNITIGSPVDYGDYAQWPAPTAMSNSPAYITVPVRYKNSLGVVSQASVSTLQLTFADPGAQGAQGYGIDISGYTSFTQNSGGAFTPASATLSALLTNVTSPTYSWSISGATPTTSTSSSVVITPNSSATIITVTLTVNGSNLPSAISKTIKLPVVYDGAPGTAGSNGVMSAFPSIFIWTGAAVPPVRPTTTSTYTWATANYSAPSGWSTSAPSNTTAGNYLWELTVPLNTVATTTTSLVDWTNVSYPIRAVAYNGDNGLNGTDGTNGSNGSATFVITRVANDGSAPTNAEVSGLLGRNPVAGDICTVSYNNYNNAVVYRYVTSWVLFNTYITGSLIVENTITADKISSNTVLTQALRVGTSGSLPVISGTTMTGAGAYLYADGRFALGDSSKNITYNGTQATLNGFTSGTTATNSSIVTWDNSGPLTVSLLTFTITQTGLIVVNGNYIVDIATTVTGSLAATYISGGFSCNFNLFNSAGAQVSGSAASSHIASGAFRAQLTSTSWLSDVVGAASYQKIITLTPDTYTLKMSMDLVSWVDPSGTIVSCSVYSSWTPYTSGSLNGNSYAYQALI